MKFSKSGFFSKKIPLNIGILIIIVFAGMAVFLSASRTEQPKKAEAVPAADCNEKVNLIQDNAYSHTHPLLIAALPEQSQQMAPLKAKLAADIENKKKNNLLNNASVHVMKLNSGEWIGYNQDEKFTSGGYIRLAMLITFLKMSEIDPAIMNRQIVYSPPSSYRIKDDKVFGLISGKTYSVKDLLGFMMQNPDTNARVLLSTQMNKEIFNKLFSDLGLEQPDIVNRKYFISVSEYSMFLHLIYNGRFLNEADSEYALQLLAGESQKKGMRMLLPDDVKVIHKYSERFRNNLYELRESGIIYFDDNSYLVTIFANGKNNELLEQLIAEISKDVYDFVSNRNNP
jgi:beta-lactamase class A